MKFSREIMKGATPFIIMQVLHELKEGYGYQIMKTIREQSDEVFDFPDSTLYPILYRLEQKGLITSDIKELEGKKTRRYYWLTEQGLDYLGVQEKEMKHYLKGLGKFIPGHTFGIKLA